MSDRISRRRLLGAGATVTGLWFWPGASSVGAAARPNVVATFSILADFVKNVGGDRIELATLVGPDGDAHVYAPTPADAKRVATANLVFVNGLGFEGWMARLIKASGTTAAIVVAAAGIMPRQNGEALGRIDPHAWQAVGNAKVYVGNIRNALVAADRASAPLYETRAARYLEELDTLDHELRAQVAGIPAARRKIITTHDAFGYFHDAYGIDFLAPEGVSTEAEPSARDVAEIIRQIRRENIPAVFLENISDPRLLQRIVAETGAKIGGTLYSDALTPANGEASTYIAMMRHNIAVLSAALSS